MLFFTFSFLFLPFSLLFDSRNFIPTARRAVIYRDYNDSARSMGSDRRWGCPHTMDFQHFAGRLADKQFCRTIRCVKRR